MAFSLLIIQTIIGITALPSAEVTEKPFSFASWVEDLSSPNIVAMTPEQVLDAYNASRARSIDEWDGAERRFKRDVTPPLDVACWTTTWNHATSIDEAVTMIAQLVAKGQEQVLPIVPGIKNMQVHVLEMAQSMGQIMDWCTWDNLTGGWRSVISGEFYISMNSTTDKDFNGNPIKPKRDLE
ncbi:hypothetical protein B0T20DRAFT_483730 [Sordaria brevicollis]|uniref:Uncharacterized protein n=1 Tax=Sordaria brevicollis TaxID=83679 RepID=A0AAE0NWH2_SORBR|nr:hypothetical protein B0T20DRAFT_483730 [Sordaria brevicollis]